MPIANRTLRGTFWIGLYLLITLAPLIVVFGWTVVAEPYPPAGRDFWTEFSVALGFMGLAMISLQFLVTARLRRVQAPYGVDIVYQFHKMISIVAFALILAHPAIYFAVNRDELWLLNPLVAPWRARAAMLAVLCLVALVVTSLWRRQIGLNYEAWRVGHGLLAIAIIALSYWHVLGVGHYLAQPWQRALWAGMAVAVVGVSIYTRIVKPIILIRTPYRVEAVRPERGRTQTLVLRADGHRGIAFRPGQFAWLTIGTTPFNIEEHPFSYSSSAVHPERVEFTIKELGDFTRRVKEIPPGTKAHIDGPYGVFTIDRHHAPGYVFIAGGIGITPFMSMLRTLEDRRDTRPVLLIYANKSWDNVIFREELEAMTDRENLRIVHVLEDAPDDWAGDTGFVTAEILARYLPEQRLSRHCFICGPPAMLVAVQEALLDVGVPLTHVHMEQFELV